MKNKKGAVETDAVWDEMALDESDVAPMSAAMRRRWEAARRTGEKLKRGRPRKQPEAKSRIVPVSIEPLLLERVDEYAKKAGISRSRLVAEGLQLRIKR
jgi:hypothetical protein